MKHSSVNALPVCRAKQCGILFTIKGADGEELTCKYLLFFSLRTCFLDRKLSWVSAAAPHLVSQRCLLSFCLSITVDNWVGVTQSTFWRKRERLCGWMYRHLQINAAFQRRHVHLPAWRNPPEGLLRLNVQCLACPNHKITFVFAWIKHIYWPKKVRLISAYSQLLRWFTRSMNRPFGGFLWLKERARKVHVQQGKINVKWYSNTSYISGVVGLQQSRAITRILAHLVPFGHVPHGLI